MTSVIREKPAGLHRIIAIAIPPVMLVAFIFVFSIEAPIADQWDLVPLLKKSFEGGIEPIDLWAQHNEHRMLFPRLIMIALAHATSWTILYELLASFVAACGIFFLLSKILKESNSNVPPVLLSFVIFSLSQSEGWLNGWNLQIYLNVVAACGMFLALTRNSIGWSLLGFVFFAISFLSYASGIVLWPIGLIILTYKIKKQLPFAWLLAAMWAAGGALLLGLYLHNYHHPPQHLPVSSAFHKPLQLTSYVLSYLGSPLFAFTRKSSDVHQWFEAHGIPIPDLIFQCAALLPTLAGFLGMLVFCRTAVRIFQGTEQKNGPHSGTYSLALLAIGLFAIGSAILSGLGRVGFANFSALSLRYIPISNLFWISLLAGFYRPESEQRMLKKRMLIGALATLILLNSIYGTLYAAKHHALLKPAQKELALLKDAQLLKRLYPDPERLIAYADVLKKYRLNVYGSEIKSRHD